MDYAVHLIVSTVPLTDTKIEINVLYDIINFIPDTYEKDYQSIFIWRCAISAFILFAL